MEPSSSFGRPRELANLLTLGPIPNGDCPIVINGRQALTVSRERQRTNGGPALSRGRPEPWPFLPGIDVVQPDFRPVRIGGDRLAIGSHGGSGGIRGAEIGRPGWVG